MNLDKNEVRMRPRDEIVKELNKKSKSQIARRPEDLHFNRKGMQALGEAVAE